jgi:hypothetical protein
MPLVTGGADRDVTIRLTAEGRRAAVREGQALNGLIQLGLGAI